MRREIKILGTWNSTYHSESNDDNWKTVLQSMSNQTLKLKPLVSHTIELAEAVEALQKIQWNPEQFCKVLIKP
jgi:threonine dehydrogenase-like Zn-dependent dehydrogenase